jgi:hypothetical protein
MHHDQTVSAMAKEVLVRQAKIRAEQAKEPLGEALAAVLETEAGRQLRVLCEGPHHDERAEWWQEELPRKRTKERKRSRQEECIRARQEAAWAMFMQAELRELELRKDGQLARLLGEPLPGEQPAAVLQLASEDRRQAEEGVVALMSNGKVYYKHLVELSEEDMAARVAAKRLRTTWLKERQEDRWYGRGTGYL